MSDQASPALSLVVATFGRADVLERLVASLVAQTCGDFEVIVADQNRDDSIRPYLAPLAARGRLGSHLRLDAPNLSRARNAGLAAARGRIVAFPDDDCWYEPDTVARVVEAFSVGPSLDGVTARWPEAAAEKGDATGRISSEAMRRFRGGNVASITLFLRRAAVVSAGGFDERIGVGRWYGSGEETDLVLSLLDGGARLERRADIVVHHPAPATAALPWVQQFHRERRRARGTGALYAKHRLPPWVVGRGLVAPILAVPRMGLADGLAKTTGRLEGLVRWSLGEPRQDRLQVSGASAPAAEQALQIPGRTRETSGQ